MSYLYGSSTELGTERPREADGGATIELPPIGGAYGSLLRAISRRRFLRRAALTTAAAVTVVLTGLGVPAPKTYAASQCNICVGNCAVCGTCVFQCFSPDFSCNTQACCSCPAPDCNLTPYPCGIFFVYVWSCDNCVFPSGTGGCPTCP